MCEIGEFRRSRRHQRAVHGFLPLIETYGPQHFPTLPGVVIARRSARSGRSAVAEKGHGVNPPRTSSPVPLAPLPVWRHRSTSNYCGNALSWAASFRNDPGAGSSAWASAEPLIR
ncbi:hypothetical protein GCM10010298_39430 [Streptomyces microflavus]|nr:hypothetical protein GCM10010298_39430 [Streptomyces microflavus]